MFLPIRAMSPTLFWFGRGRFLWAWADVGHEIVSRRRRLHGLFPKLYTVENELDSGFFE
jgi:hypothetical protein